MDIKRIGLIMALGWIVVKMVLFNLDLSDDAPLIIGAGVNMLFLLIVIFVAVRHHHLKGRGTSLYLDDVKAGMKQAAIYTLLVSLFVFAYYKWIDTDFIPDRIEARVEAEEVRIDKAGGWEGFVKKNVSNNPELKEMSQKDYLEGIEDTAKNTIMTPGSFLALGLVALISISFLYSLIISLIYRKVLVKYER